MELFVFLSTTCHEFYYMIGHPSHSALIAIRRLETLVPERLIVNDAEFHVARYGSHDFCLTSIGLIGCIMSPVENGKLFVMEFILMLNQTALQLDTKALYNALCLPLADNFGLLSGFTLN